MSVQPSTDSSTVSSTVRNESQYRLIYFRSQGKAEVSRYLFALARQPFVDERVSRSASAAVRPAFDRIQPSLPFGQLPVLHVDAAIGSVVLCQSKAIERFLAHRFQLMGNGDVEEQQVDSVVEAMRDLTQAYAGSRADLVSQSRFLTHTLPSFLQQLERFGRRCGSSVDRNTLVGLSLTLADVVVYHTFFLSQRIRSVRPYSSSSTASHTSKQSLHTWQGGRRYKSGWREGRLDRHCSTTWVSGNNTKEDIGEKRSGDISQGQCRTAVES